MDFKFALTRIVERLEKEKIQYGLIGGIALGFLGVNRATTDTDFLIQNKDADIVDKIMYEFGYELTFRSNNYSLFQSPLKPLGKIDFLHPDSPVIQIMLERKESHAAFQNELDVFVLKTEDIIGLKLQAIKNDPKRNLFDGNDILQLLKIHNKKIDLTIINDYAKKLEMTDYFEKLIRESAH